MNKKDPEYILLQLNSYIDDILSYINEGGESLRIVENIVYDIRYYSNKLEDAILKKGAIK
jgi:hypothetical protein